MKMTLKKVVVNSVVYETKDEAAPCSSVYISKAYLRDKLKVGLSADWPAAIELEIKPCQLT